MQRDLHKLETTEFDLLVIGGGIYGISIARDATLRGLNVALVEADDFGSRTSHNSLKIIHGGIRYLQHFNFKRVQESVREREMWVNISHNIIRPLKFVLPTYGYGTRGPFALAAAIKMHNYVARMQNKNRAYPDGHIISKTACQELIPELDNGPLTGGAVWYDGQILDADRLHIELLKDACAKGLYVANHLKVNDINIVAKKATGVTVTDQINYSTFDIRANLIVNATGPWAYSLLRNHVSKKKYQFQSLSKNFNIVIDHIGKDFAFGIKSTRDSDAVVGSSKRMYFLTPWLNKTVIGTAHFTHESEELNFDIDRELPGFIDEINQAFPSLNLDENKISYRYVGYTPTDSENKKQKPSRAHLTSIIDHEIEDGIENLLSVIGVKYTTARNTAQYVVDLAQSKLKLDASEKNVVDDYSLDHQLDDCSNINLLSLHDHVSKNEIEFVYLKHIDQHIKYAINNEMSLKLDDYILRRNNLAVRGYLNKNQIEQITASFCKIQGIRPADVESELHSVFSSLGMQ